MTRRAILILGAAVWADGPSPTLLRRTRHAFTLWQGDPAALLVPCGGLGRHPPSEAEAMQELLCAWGVPPEMIALEAMSTSTLENIAFAAPILRGRGILRATIVSDRYHGKRALMVARRLGLSADFSGPPAPQGRRMHHARQQLREVGARIIYAGKLRGSRWH